MELTRQSISNHSRLIPGLEGYLLLVEKVEKNVGVNPDIAIESCKSLIEGLCKKGLKLLSEEYQTNKQLRKNCDNKLPTLVRTAFTEVYRNRFEVDIHGSLYGLIEKSADAVTFVQKLENRAKKKAKQLETDIDGAILKISVIRDNRGDISHGRIYPKSEESDVHLARSISAITDGICSFMIEEVAIQYSERKKGDSKLVYKEHDEFNSWLDEVHNVTTIKVDFSKILYESAYGKYEEFYYQEYIPLQEMDDDESEQTPTDRVTEPKASSVSAAEVLVSNFDEQTFWNDGRIERLRVFEKSEYLDADKLKEVINEFLFTEKIPLRDEVADSMNQKPSLKNRATEIKGLTDKIIALASELKSMETEP
jgi:hypothetical protein